MKKILLVLSLFAFSFGAIAQTSSDYIEVVRSVLKTEKKAAIAEVMQLSEAEGTAFWPLYNEYTEQVYLIQSKRIQIIQDYAKNYENMTDEKATEIMKSYMSYKKELLSLNNKYYKKFLKVMPGIKVALYFQAENKIATMVDYQLAMEIPFFE